MTGETLTSWSPGPMMIVILIVFGIPVLLIVLAVRYALQSNKERRRLRLELGKLADELEKTREQVKGDQQDKSSAKSG